MVAAPVCTHHTISWQWRQRRLLARIATLLGAPWGPRGRISYSVCIPAHWLNLSIISLSNSDGRVRWLITSWVDCFMPGHLTGWDQSLDWSTLGQVPISGAAQAIPCSRNVWCHLRTVDTEVSLKIAGGLGKHSKWHIQGYSSFGTGHWAQLAHRLFMS